MWPDKYNFLERALGRLDARSFGMSKAGAPLFFETNC